MEVMNQPFTGQLGSRLIQLLDSTDYQTLDIIVAFAKNSGVLRIKDALERFRQRGGAVNVLVGVDLGGTSYEALTALLLHTDSLRVVHSETGQTFHSKIYNFHGATKNLVIVGSHNLTAGGLWTNFESSLIIPVSNSVKNELELQNGVDKYFGELTSLVDSSMPIRTQLDVEKLMVSGYISKEVAEQVRRKNSASKQKGQRLFGNGATANLPRINTPSRVGTPSTVPTPRNQPKAISVRPGEEGQTIWFETRRMTGGSRNILDLSKKSLVEHGDPKGTPFALSTPKFMRGGVEFFGLTPSDTTMNKKITINFEGVDYGDNVILFPTGQKANGTWRLQINGTTVSGLKITDALRAKSQGDYLVNKIVTFTRVHDGYYFMTVLPTSNLEGFIKASILVGRNGSTRNAKLLGVL